VNVELDGKRRLYALCDDGVRDLLDAALRHIQLRGGVRRATTAAVIDAEPNMASNVLDPGENVAVRRAR
jgi:hypothetical protein